MSNKRKFCQTFCQTRGENFTLDMFEPGIEIEDNPNSDDMVYDCPDHSFDYMTGESEEKYGESL